MNKVITFISLFTLSFLFLVQNVWASQTAIVSVEQAIIYSDEQMSSPLGFLRKGKKVQIGDVARNKAQVYPIIISRKMAWIRVVDVTTERESANSDQLTAERFQKRTSRRDGKSRSLYSLSMFQFSSQISLNAQNGKLANNDPLSWTGLSLRGEGWMSPDWDIQVITNLLSAKEGDEQFRIFELGAGAAYKIYNGSFLSIKLDTQALLIPFATYELGSLYRKKSYGFSAGTGLNFGFLLGSNWGMEAYGGFYYTKLTNIDAPAPYKAISPSFIGSRLGVGLTYQM